MEEITLEEYRARTKKGSVRAKFGNVRTEVDGYHFDSKAEAQRYGELKLLERCGAIAGLQIHPTYEIVAASAYGRAWRYEADFSYVRDGQRVAEDVKGGKATQTELFKLKARLFVERYPDIKLEIVER